MINVKIIIQVADNCYLSFCRVTMSSQEPVIINDVLKKQQYPSVSNIQEDSDDSPDLDLSSWEVSQPDPGFHDVATEALATGKMERSVNGDVTRPKQKRWKETALANASLKKKQKRKSKPHSAYDMYPEVNSQSMPMQAVNMDNYSLENDMGSNVSNKSRNRTPSHSHGAEPWQVTNGKKDNGAFSLAKYNGDRSPSPAVHRRNRSRSPKVRRRERSPAAQKLSSNDLPSKSRQIVDDNSSDDYSTYSYSQIKSIQVQKPPVPPKLETEVNIYNGESELPDRLRHLQVKDVPLNRPLRENTEASWHDRQMPQPPSHSPLPPPADFSDDDFVRDVDNHRAGSKRVNQQETNQLGQSIGHEQQADKVDLRSEESTDFSRLYGSVSQPLRDREIKEVERKLQHKPVKPPRKNRPSLDNVVSH